jgi:branched-chain amino acid transport system substrate-binding protein
MTRRHWKWFGIILALALGIVGPGMAQNSTETLKVAVITGSDADEAALRGALLAAGQINVGDDDDVAGIAYSSSTYELEVVGYAATTRTEALEAYDEAISDGAAAVVVPSDRSMAQAILDERTASVPLLSLAADAPQSSSLIAISASADDWAQAAADYLAAERQLQRIAVVSTNTTSANAGTQSFREALEVTPVLDTVVEAEASSFSGVARDIRSSRAEALFVWMLDAQSAALIAALDDIGWNGVIVAAGMSSAAAASIQAEQVFAIANWSPVASDAASEAFRQDYTAAYGEAPAALSAAGYDAVMLLADAISRGGTSASSLRTQLAAADMTGVQGRYADSQTQGLRLIEAGTDGLEVAFYDAGVCANCPDTWRADVRDTSVSATSTFTIGLVTSTTGVNQALGSSIEQAVRLALREINALGGVIHEGTRYSLNVRVYNATTADEARTALQQAGQDGVQIVLGPDSNAQVLNNLAALEGVQLVSAGSAQIATVGSDSLYQMRASDKTLLEALSAYLMGTLDQTRFAFVAARTDYGLDAMDAFEDLVEASDDGELALTLDHDLSQTDFAAFAERIVAANVESVVVWTTQPAASALLQALEALGWQGTFAYGYLTPDFLAAAQTSLPIVGPVNWWPESGTWASQQFTQAYAERYSAQPSPQSAAYYDAVYMIADALEAEGPDAAAISGALAEFAAFNGVQGVYRPAEYDSGELTRSAIILRHEGGVTTAAARYDGATCLAGCQ